MKLLESVHRALEDLGVAHALIGAAALAAHGVSRATLDVDLLTTDARVLEPSALGKVEAEGGSVETRRGDADDPLAGVVRIERVGDRPVDVVVGRAAWQDDIIRRAETVRIGAVDVRVATAADVVLLKLYAGGLQDRWDVAQLLGGSDRDANVAAVEERLAQLPARCRALWADLLR